MWFLVMGQQRLPRFAMLAFKAWLPDTDRWNLVNFIQMLAPKWVLG